jgi:hypothetical protein
MNKQDAANEVADACREELESAVKATAVSESLRRTRAAVGR